MLVQSVDVVQQAILVEYDPRRMTADESTAELNRVLAEGWQIVGAHPMGGGGSHDNPRFVSLVILNREIKDATS